MLNEIRKTFLPPYNSKDLFSIFITIFVMIAIPLTVLQVSTIRDPRSSASTETLINPNLRVVINSPKNEAQISGVVTIQVDATNSSSVISSIKLSVDGKTLATNNNPSSTNNFTTSFSWDTTKGSNGPKTIIATVFDDQLRSQTSTPVTNMVINTDTEIPNVGFIQPVDGEYLSGSTYTVRINAEDNLAIKDVVLELDGKTIKTFSKVPYTHPLDLVNLKTGSHELKVSGVDFSGNRSETTITIYKGVKGINF